MYHGIPNFLSRRHARGSDEHSAPRGSIPGPLRNSFDDIYEAILRGRDPNTNGTRNPNPSSFNAENSNNVPRGPNNPRGNQNPVLFSYASSLLIACGWRLARSDHLSRQQPPKTRLDALEQVNNFLLGIG